MNMQVNEKLPAERLQYCPMTTELTLAFIGGGNMAAALGAGLIGKRCGAHDVHVIDPFPQALKGWADQGASVAAQADATLSTRRVWVFAVKPQLMKEAVLACRPYLQPDTLIISVAAGIPATAIADWLGGEGEPHQRVIRCMPNTPALIGAGASGLMALPAVTADERQVAEQMMRAVGEYVWVDTDAHIDAVTALSGSGPAYVFLFLEALIARAEQLGLSFEQARKLALATVTGATQLAALSPEPLATLRDRVTSKGGTTAAALQVFTQQGFTDVVGQAMQAANDRAAELSKEFAG